MKKVALQPNAELGHRSGASHLKLLRLIGDSQVHRKSWIQYSPLLPGTPTGRWSPTSKHELCLYNFNINNDDAPRTQTSTTIQKGCLDLKSTTPTTMHRQKQSSPLLPRWKIVATSQNRSKCLAASLRRRHLQLRRGR